LHISRYLLELGERLEELQQELKKVREWVLALEEENRQLRKELERRLSPSAASPPEEGPGVASSGCASLQRLYEEGFHVCPYSFGQRRQGDCIFCVALLEQAGGSLL